MYMYDLSISLVGTQSDLQIYMKYMCSCIFFSHLAMLLHNFSVYISLQRQFNANKDFMLYFLWNLFTFSLKFDLIMGSHCYMYVALCSIIQNANRIFQLKQSKQTITVLNWSWYAYMYTERQKKLITSSEWHSLKSTASKWFIFGHRLGKFIINNHILKNKSLL